MQAAAGQAYPVEDLSRLHRAVKSNRPEEVATLLNAGTAVDSVIGDWAPLHLAAALGHIDVARIFLEAGATVDIRGAGGWTPLHRAAKLGHVEVTKLLIQKGADVQAEGIDGWTPLLRAAMAGRAATGRILIDAGADIHVVSRAQQWTPLHWAAFSGSKALAEMLLSAGANVNAREGTSATPLYLARHYGHDEVATLLRQFGGVAGNE